jgi:hypothetical protein
MTRRTIAALLVVPAGVVARPMGNGWEGARHPTAGHAVVRPSGGEWG